MCKLKVNEEVTAVYKMKANAREGIKMPAKKDQRPTHSQEEHVLEKVGKKHQVQQCPAHGKEWHNYKKKNHVVNCCKVQANIPSKPVYMVEEADSEPYFVTYTRRQRGQQANHQVYVHTVTPQQHS